MYSEVKIGEKSCCAARVFLQNCDIYRSCVMLRPQIDMELMKGTTLLCKKMLATEKDQRSQSASRSFIRRHRE